MTGGADDEYSAPFATARRNFVLCWAMDNRWGGAG